MTTMIDSKTRGHVNEIAQRLGAAIAASVRQGSAPQPSNPSQASHERKILRIQDTQNAWEAVAEAICDFVEDVE